MKLTTALLALLLPLPLLAAERIEKMPPQFVGQWAGSLALCTSSKDSSLLRVGHEEISYAETAGLLEAIVQRDEQEVAMIAEVVGEGEDGSTLEATVLKLSNDGNQLTAESSASGRSIVRVRCPKH